MSGSHPTYRADIDGLRALAIVPVVLFHAFPQAVPGGFVGVDVFFVISGFLISSIILTALDDGTFTLRGFYQRRIRRIFPALVLMLAACLAWGWWQLFASDYALLGKHIAAGAGFAANLVLWSEASYFDTTSDTKPLLHLWSLGIEEQFYLVWPALLAAAWAGRKHLLLVVGAVLVLSFLYNAVLVRSDEVAAFYSPATRLWELALGGAFAVVTLARARPTFRRAWTDRFWTRYGPSARELSSVLGLIAIAASVVLFSPETSFPGWRAAFPAGGALLLIAGGPESGINRHLLAVRPLVAIGLISYPLYLWHWPLLSFATLTASTTATSRTMAIAASVLLAWATYRFVEHPIRFTWRSSAPVVGLCALMLATGVAGYVTFVNDGFIERPINRSDEAHFLQYYEQLRTQGLAAAYRAECDFMDWRTEQTRSALDPSCTIGGAQGTMFLWGDSHAQALSPGLRRILPEGWQLAQVTTSACPPRWEEQNPHLLSGRCAKANAHAKERIAMLRPDVVVLAQILAHDLTDWGELARAIKGLGAARVVLVGPMPQWLPGLPLVVTQHFWDSDYTFVDRGLTPELFQLDAVLEARYARSPDLSYVSLIAGLCRPRRCLAVAPGTDTLMVVDNAHLSAAGSYHVAKAILQPHLFGG